MKAHDDALATGGRERGMDLERGCLVPRHASIFADGERELCNLPSYLHIGRTRPELRWGNFNLKGRSDGDAIAPFTHHGSR